MNIVFVTSRVTYVRDNYYALLKHLSSNRNSSNVSLLVIDNLTPGLVVKALLLILAGARKTGAILLYNMLTSFSRKREGLFRSYRHFKTINDDSAIDYLQTHAPDLIINLRTREIFGNRVLAIPALGCINVHHGLLPENRGTLCDLWALYEKRPPGFTVHYMNEKIDAGDIIVTRKTDVHEETDYTKIPMMSSLAEAEALDTIIDRLNSGDKIQRIPNVSDSVRYTKNPTFKEIRAMKQSGLTL